MKDAKGIRRLYRCKALTEDQMRYGMTIVTLLRDDGIAGELVLSGGDLQVPDEDDFSQMFALPEKREPWVLFETGKRYRITIEEVA